MPRPDDDPAGEGALRIRLLPHLSRETGPGLTPFQGLRLAGVAEAAAFWGCPQSEAMARCLEQDIWPLRFKGNRGLLSGPDQAALLRRHVAVIGCGGLGGHVLLLLARLGIGALTLCDCDAFDESNLNRQRLCREDRIGMNKALAAREELALVASHLAAHARTEAATPDNLPEMLAGADLVMDCLDSLFVRRQVENAAHALGIPFVHGAIAGCEGFAMLCPPPPPGEKSGLTRLYGAHILEKSTGSEATSGVPTPTPVAIAVLQVMLALRCLLGSSGPGESLAASASSLLPDADESPMAAASSHPALPAPAHALWHLDLSLPELEILLV